MPPEALHDASACPPWCAGHHDDQEPTPARWHRSEGTVVAVTERRRFSLGSSNPASLSADDFVVALEKDAQSTYVYIGPLEDGARFFAVTRESAERLHTVVGEALARLRNLEG